MNFNIISVFVNELINYSIYSLQLPETMLNILFFIYKYEKEIEANLE